jgi:hypothetical protein
MKEAKDLYLSPAPRYPAMAWIYEPAQTQKSFGSFLQKRTLLPRAFSHLTESSGIPKTPGV